MATKLENETRVRELEEQLKVLDPDAVGKREKEAGARIEQLERELDLGREAAVRLNSQLESAEQKSEAAARALDDMRLALERMQLELRAASDGQRAAMLEQESLHADVIRLQADVGRLSAGQSMTGDYAVVDGQPFSVAHRSTAKWVHLLHQRREVAEDATTLVLDRTGE